MLPLVATVQAMAIAGARCGAKICEVSQFCSKFHSDCEECSKICDASNHNFESELCKTECRDYLHDQTYVKKTDYAAEIRSLKVYVTISYILVLLVLVLFFVINGRRIFSWLRESASKFCTKKKVIKTEPVTMENPHTESPKLRKKDVSNLRNFNRTSSIFTVSGTEYDQKTVSTPISRHPAEDTLTNSATTVDYSYDNKALQLTPVGEEKPRTETNF